MEKDGESLPNGYKEGITRVSELVSFIHPFDWTDGHRRYLMWLYESLKDKIEFKWEWDDNKYKQLKKLFPDLPDFDKVVECDYNYMNEACLLWTFVHEQCENVINWNPVVREGELYNRSSKETELWVLFYKELKDDISWKMTKE